MADLCRAMEAILARAEPREYNLYCPERPTLEKVLVLLREKLGRKTLFVPLPAWALVVPLTVLGRLHIPTPLDLENLKGYTKSKEPVHASDLTLVVPSPASFEAALAQAWSR